MHNGIGGMPAAPIDMLLDFTRGLPSEGASDSGEFGRILGLSGEIPGEGSGLPIPGMDLGPNPDVAVVEITQLLLPQELVQALGLGAQVPVESTGRTISQDTPESPIPLRAELLATKDDNNQALYLKLLPGNVESDTIQLTSGSGDDSEEMILPMRLRTVEQQGGRIIADAELQTATGKDASIRLRLEIAGNPERIQEAISRPESVGDATARPMSQGTDLSLPRLLHNLDAKSLIIEHIGGDLDTVSKETLPRMVSLLRTIGDHRISGDPSAPVNSNTDKIGTQPETARIAPITTGDEESNSVKTGNNRNKMEGLIIDRTTGQNQPSVQLSNVGVDVSPSGMTTIPVSEIGNAAGQSETSSDLTQVRFYDLDHKLDQLKHNPGQKIRIQLLPSRLGRMELSIASNRGLITVNLALDSVQAKQAVERNLAQLESHLASSGIRVDSFQLHVNQSSKGASYSAYQQQYDQAQDGFTGHRRRGFHQPAHDRERLEQFNMTETGFKQSLINCLA